MFFYFQFFFGEYHLSWVSSSSDTDEVTLFAKDEALEGGVSISYSFNYFEKYPISLK